MLDVIAVVGTSLMFLFGWFLMKRLDRFLDENQKRIDETYGQRQPEPCVRLDGDLPIEELEETIARFRGSHAHVNIVIYDPEELPFRQNESDFTQ